MNNINLKSEKQIIHGEGFFVWSARICAEGSY